MASSGHNYGNSTLSGSQAQLGDVVITNNTYYIFVSQAPGETIAEGNLRHATETGITEPILHAEKAPVD